MKYVKICPRCGHQNGELAEVCDKDGEFLGMVPATPAAPRPAAPEPAPAAAPAVQASPAAPVAPAPADPGTRAESAPPAPAILYLDCEDSGQCHAIRPGWIVGQSHPTSTAEAQLAQTPGIQFVHRRHCRFDCEDGQWYVTPIPQADYTNPTSVNNRRVAPGVRMPVRNGDRLMLAGVGLTVRILGA